MKKKKFNKIIGIIICISLLIGNFSVILAEADTSDTTIIINSNQTEINVNVSKEWTNVEGELIPDSVTVELHLDIDGDGTYDDENIPAEFQKIITLSANADENLNWKYTWENLPYSNGYQYTIEEISIDGVDVTSAEIEYIYDIITYNNAMGINSLIKEPSCSDLFFDIGSKGFLVGKFTGSISDQNYKNKYFIWTEEELTTDEKENLMYMLNTYENDKTDDNPYNDDQYNYKDMSSVANNVVFLYGINDFYYDDNGTDVLFLSMIYNNDQTGILINYAETSVWSTFFVGTILIKTDATVKNTLDDPADVVLTKTWVGVDGVNFIYPEYITLILHKVINGNDTTQNINLYSSDFTTNIWTYSDSSLEKYIDTDNNGFYDTEVQYYLEEVALDNFTTIVSGLNVTNIAHGSLIIYKDLDMLNEANGDAIYTYKVVGVDEYNSGLTFYVTINYTDGERSATISNIPVGIYEIREISTIRYLPYNNTNSSEIVVAGDTGYEEVEPGGIGYIEYYNVMVKSDWNSHTDLAVNHFEVSDGEIISVTNDTGNRTYTNGTIALEDTTSIE